MSDRSAFIEKLEAAHAFPGPYLFKIIGENQDGFIQTIEKALKDFEIQETTHRLSKEQKHISVSITVIAPSADSVLDAYEALGNLKEVKYVL